MFPGVGTIDPLQFYDGVQTKFHYFHHLFGSLILSVNWMKAEPVLSGSVHEYRWRWQSDSLTITYEVLGEGTPILLLPAFSTVSSRSEMGGLAEALVAAGYQVVILDWLGFGQSSRPAINYQPKVYHALLRDFVQSVFSKPVVVIAAGHTAGYVMELAQKNPSPWAWVVLVSPTWRGPLPTMGNHRWFYKWLRRLINLPLVGQFLYALNTLPPFLRFMYRRHVFAEAQNIKRDLIRQKWRTTQRPRARLASAAFVTGALDPIQTREQWLSWFQPLPPMPVLMVIGEQTPPKSREEMEVVALFSAVQVVRLPGSLGLHEEYPDKLAAEILPFLKKLLS